MRATPGTQPISKTHALRGLCLLALPVFAAVLLAGCQSERPVVAPAEPTWDYRDGQTQLSNNAAWERMIPTTVLVVDESQVASVEEATE